MTFDQVVEVVVVRVEFATFGKQFRRLLCAERPVLLQVGSLPPIRRSDCGLALAEVIDRVAFRIVTNE